MSTKTKKVTYKLVTEKQWKQAKGIDNNYEVPKKNPFGLIFQQGVFEWKKMSNGNTETFTDIKSKEKELFVNWINSINEHVIIKFKDDYLLTNALAVDFINKHTHLYLKKVGTTIGSLIKNEVIPHHDLALSIHKNEQIKIYDCENDEAIRFMKKENFKIDCDNGWVLISHKQFGLGWIKQLGNRFNNYLPNDFRILK
jgi:NOL1/NOP2/fmu family ribosome biogenesis protein